MSKFLVCFFSASGVTKAVAESVATVVKGDLFEIEPVEKYTEADLDWTNKQSRSSLEMNNRTYRPPVKSKVQSINEYDKVIIGFPVWWYTAPTIVNTFIEENNLEGKDVYVFVTSGSSGSKGSFEDLKKTYPHINFVSSIRLNKNVSNKEIEDWLGF